MLPHLERAALIHDYLTDPFNRPGWIKTRGQVDGIFYDALMFYALRGNVTPGWYARQVIRAKAVIAWSAVRAYSIIHGDN